MIHSTMFMISFPYHSHRGFTETRVKSHSSEGGHQHDRNSIQYRERSDRMPALNHRFKSSWDYRVPASGRFARGTVLGGDTNRIIHASIAKFLATRYPPE